MRFQIILDGMGLILILFALSFLGPIWTGVVYHEDPYRLFLAYGIPIILCLGTGFSIRVLMHERFEQIRVSEALVMVALTWLVLAGIGALPYIALGAVSDAASAYFESMSGFTTTGATVISGLDDLDKSLLLWRSLTAWLGGMGVIVLSVAILSRFFGANINTVIIQAEVPGGRVTRMAPRMAQTARLLWGIYVLFTVILIGLLMAVGNWGEHEMSLFDAVNHAMAAMPTDGFTTHDKSVGYFDNPAVEFVITVFLIIAGTNFVLHYNALRGRWREYLKDPEMRFTILMVVLAIVFVTGDLAVRGIYSVDQSFRFGSFAVVSVVTTTGFATADFALWPVSSQLVLLMLMFFGGTMGSTAGGIKMVRVLIILKSIRVLFNKVTHRRGVFHVKLGNVIIPDAQVASTAVYVLLYMGLIGLGSLLISLDGTDMVTSISSTVTAIGNVGPALGMYGPATTFAAMSGVSKIIMAALMWIGRLEILGCLLLFNPKALAE